MAWRFNKVEDQRKELIEAYIKGDVTMTELARRFGVSRRTAYKWYNRYVLNGFDEMSLQDLSRAPHQPWSIFNDNQIELMLDMKLAHKQWGPKKILARLQRDYPNERWPSATRLYEIFKDHHLVTSRRIKRKVCGTHPLGELNQCNDVWIADFKGWFLTLDNAKCEPLTITDGYSRYLISCEHLSSKSSAYAWTVFEKAFREYGLPGRLRTDNGPPFGSVGVGRLTALSVNLIKAGVIPEWINPGHPEENGRHERFHLTLKQAVTNPPEKTLSKQIEKMKRFQEEYNFERPHEALGMNTPASQYIPSRRQWDGQLRSPEYDTKIMEVRKVQPSGCISLKRTEYYLGRALPGEYIGLRREGEGYQVYYGPVYLGYLTEGQQLLRPKRALRKRA